MRRTLRCVSWLLLAALPLAAGCRDLIVPNVAAGLRDGSITALTGILEDFFNNRFGLDGAGSTEGGNDLFVHP